MTFRASIGLGLLLLSVSCVMSEAPPARKPQTKRVERPEPQTAPLSRKDTTEPKVDWSLLDFPSGPDFRWREREKLCERVTIREGEGWTHTFDFYKTGDFAGGPYRGGMMVLVIPTIDQPCKGEGCDYPLTWRFAKVGNRMVFLSRISNGKLEFPCPECSPFPKLGFTVEQDSSFTVPALEYPQNIHGRSNRQKLRFYREGFGRPRFDKERLAFRHETLGNVYEDGDFFIYRPDETCLLYTYSPDISVADIEWADPATKAGALYAVSSPHEVGYSYGEFETPPSLVSSSDVNLDRDLRLAGKAKNGDSIYKLKDPEHIFLKRGYEGYLKGHARMEEQDAWRVGDDFSAEARGMKRQVVSYQEYAQSVPLFFWKDPFDRLTCFYNEDFLPVTLAEPVIYLYPETTTRVSVEVEPLGGVEKSSPPYQGGWEVTAEPSGRLRVGEDRRVFPYLFWEGRGSVLAPPEDGWVVAQTKVADFFRTTLPRLGLSATETADFISAWAPRFSGSPFYLITFLPPKRINFMAPLEVSPEPDTVIRVLMDYRPLDHPIAMRPAELPAPPPRRGFTVVEWGGVRR